MKKLLKYRPPRIAALLLAVTTGIWFFSPQETLLYIPFNVIAAVSIIIGFAVMTWAWTQFRKSDTAVCPTSKTSLIVTNGAYRYSQNPMYLGMLLILTGVSFIMGTIPAMLAPIVFFIVIDRVFIPYEEDKLINDFGDVYSNYQTATGRWI